MTEQWKPIEGYEGLYEVSNLGHVRGVARIVRSSGISQRMALGRVLKPYTNKLRYQYVALSKDNKRETLSVHRLVAMAFIPNPDNLPCVNHKDEDPKNNKVENLEWCTTKYNLNYGTARERRVQKRWVAVIGTDKDGKEYRFESMAEAAEKTGAGFRNISMCCQGAKDRQTAGGYRWRYAEKTS